MIRVNLLKTLGMTGASGEGGIAASEVLTDDVKKAAGLRVLAILVPAVLIYIYEYVNISNLQDELKRTNREVSGIEQEIANFGNDAPKVAEFKEREKKVEGEKKIIRDLASLRLREVKALDALQNILPEKTWFDSLDIDAGKARIFGFSYSDTGPEEILDGLRSTVFFSNIEMKRVESVELGGANAKKFELEFQVGNKEVGK